MAVTEAMQMNAVRARATLSKSSRKWILNKWLASAIVLVTAVAVTGWYDWYDGRLGIIAPQPVIESSPAGGRIIKVPPGGNIQAALNTAQSGDIVELQAGAVYSGTVNLPNKPHTDFVTIRSSAAGDLPADKRVDPSQRASMATITSGILGRPAVQAANGAHHYRFVGIEFTASGRLFNYGVVVLGGSEKRPENVPHTIEIDRSYIHATGPTVSRRGVALNSADTIIKNSYIEGFAFKGEETQGICGWSGTRNVKIINNYIEGGAENIMFGGADPANAEMTPFDIDIRGNHINKPATWRGTATVKTLFELKNAKRVRLIDNLLTNNWEGSAFRITVRNQDGKAAFSTIEDVVIKGNVIHAAADGINILGRDDTYASQTLKDLWIENNLLLKISGGEGFDGSGYFIQVSDGENITVANNTVMNTGNIVTFHGRLPTNFVFRDNITGHGLYGIHGPVDLNSPPARTMFRDNVFVNLNRIPRSDQAFPDGNVMVESIGEIGFTDAAAADYRLTPASKYRGKGSDISAAGISGLRPD